MSFLIEHCKTIFGIICLAEIPLVAWYITSLNNKKPYKVKKMICSTLFVLSGLIAATSKDEFSSYGIIIIAGLVLSWLGDLFLAFSLRGKWFVLGLGSFLLAHVAYVVAFSFGIANYTDSAAPAVYELFIVAAVLVVAFIVKRKCEIRLDEMALPVLFYAATISMMLSRAVHLGITFFGTAENGLPICVVMIFGALMFVASDSVLVFIIFKNMSNRKTETANLVTYYIAQLIFALSVFYIF